MLDRSRIRTGTSVSPAFCAARQRRSPATIWYCLRPMPLVTINGWITPCSRIDAASSSSLSSSHSDRGCNGFASRLSIGTNATPLSPEVFDVIRASSPRPRPRRGSLDNCDSFQHRSRRSVYRPGVDTLQTLEIRRVARAEHFTSWRLPFLDWF